MKNIAIIDDNLILQWHLKKMFEGFDQVKAISSFASVEEAIDFFKNNTIEEVLPDIIFLDINFPGLDGWDFLEAFATMQAGIKKKISIYMISSSIAESDLQQSNISSLIKGYFTKPLSTEKLSAVIFG